MNLFITNLDRLKAEFGCTVLVVHHTGKDAAKKERGNTALRGASDTMILLDETDNSDGIAGGAAVFCEKQKDASEFDRYVLLKHRVELEDGQERDFLKRGAFRGVACGQFPSKRVQSLAS